MTLCIIDMQPCFEAATKPLANRIVKEIAQSKKRREGIILLEYYSIGDTHKNIIRELKSYDRQTIITKRDDDGAVELLATAQSLRFNMNHFRICGVNACCCVWETFWSVHNCTDAKLTLLSNLVSCECQIFDSMADCIKRYAKTASDRVCIKESYA